VDVAVVIDERGRPVDVRVQHPVGYGLDESVVEGIKKWIFSPAMKAGQPIRVRIYVHINFQP
jgi:TonB family protein